MPILIIATGILVLLLLILKLRMHAFVALVIVSAGIGLVSGLAPDAVLKSMQKGTGDTLGSMAFILGLGAMLGGMIAETGAAVVIARRFIRFFGEGKLPWAMVFTGFIVGVPMFYSVAFLVVIPIIFSVARETKLPLLYVAIPMISALSVTHGFLPPHPAPSAIVGIYHADLQRTMVLGLILSVPTIILGGVIFGKFFRKSTVPVPEHFFNTQSPLAARPPSFFLSVMSALMPVLLIGCSALGQFLVEKTNPAYGWLSFLGDPAISLLISVLFAVWALAIHNGHSLEASMKPLGTSLGPVAAIILIIGGGGALKQILLDTGTSQYIVDAMKNLALSPLLLAWCIAAALRIAIGSATVAALTTGGILAPLAASGVVSPELLVLATGAGSLTCSQVNDTGFWLFKEYFNTSIIETLKSWTTMETIISFVGLAGVLVMERLL